MQLDLYRLPFQSLGGKARAKSLTPEKRKEIAERAASARWAKDLPIAPFVGSIQIGQKEIPCAVLADGTRLVTSRGLLLSLDRPWRGTYATEDRTETPNFLSANNLKPFISEDLRAVLSPIKYRTETGAVREGYRAEIVRMVCHVYLQARSAGVLSKAQVRIADAAAIAMNALAEVGIKSLIDEATGYQAHRAKDALAKILEAFIAKELRVWTSTFPLDFYREIFRLKGWPFEPGSLKRPGVIGHYTNDFIYSRLAPGVLEELRHKNPPVDGRRKHKHFQWLTGDVGDSRLRAQLDGVVRLLRGSTTWDEFKVYLNKFYPRVTKTELGFEVADYSKDELEAMVEIKRE